MFEFGVYSVYSDEPLSVVGWCFAGPIQLGATFTLARDEAGAVHAVQLRIERMEAYQHDLDEIYEGLSARLFLIGEGRDLLHDKVVLRGP